jgi:glutathione S-transferase
MLKLFYAPGSCALASHIALEEAGADYQLVLVKTGENEQRSPEFLAINPKGRVPALQTDEGILTENPAILAFIAQSYPAAGLIPADPIRFAQVQAFNAFLCATVHPIFAHKWRPYRYADDAAAHAAMAAKVPAVLDEHFGLVEAQLSDGRDWLFGDYSIADAYLHVFARWYQRPGLGSPESRPLVRAHVRRMQERPAVARALQQEGSPLL